MDIKKEIIAIRQNLKAEKFDLAKTGCQRILKAHPNNNEALFLLGTVYNMQQRYNESRRLFEKVISSEPDHLDANNNLGVVFMAQNDYASAERYFRKVIEKHPAHPHALINLGNIQYHMNNYESAEIFYKKALEVSPENAKALNNIGQLLLKQKRLDGLSDLMGQILNLSSPGPAVFVGYLGAKEICQWDVVDKFRNNVLELMISKTGYNSEVGAIALAMLSDPAIENETLFQIVCKIAESIEKNCSQKFDTYEYAINSLKAGGKMRIGYLSGDFYQHVCTNHLSGMVDCYDRDRFEVYCYSNTPVEDEITRKYKANVDAFIDVRHMSDRELATRIHADGIHVLVEMSGYTSNTRIAVMGYRSAPIQISYLGYPFSTGFRSIDYAILDPYVDGPMNARYCTESSLRLPEVNAASGALCDEEILPVPAFERFGGVTFGSLINPYKLNPLLIQTWSRILGETPGTRLVLNHPSYLQEIIRRNILKEFAKYDIPEDRVTFIWEKLSNATHLYYYNDIDIALDVFPMTGGQTSLDALWMGVPVVTLVGDTHRERLTYRMIKTIAPDAEDIIAFTLEEYIQKAVALADNPARIRELHSLIAAGVVRSPLFDPERFVRRLETAYIQAWNEKFPRDRFAEAKPVDRVEYVPVRGGVQIAVSDRLDDRFAYVLKEQGGWFDPELDFAVEMVQPHMRVIDIVSEVGVYSIPMAKKMTGNGSVWAVSTDSGKTRYLQCSKTHNCLDSLHIIDTMRLGNIHLDRVMGAYGWSGIDFVRINTAGNDQGLIQNGVEFFTRSSPLIMFCINNKMGTQTLYLTSSLGKLGYDFFRLVPGLKLLVPFHPVEASRELDEFSMHLFCCKEDRAEMLEKRGLLLRATSSEAVSIEYEASVLDRYLSGFPYAEGLMAHWLNPPCRQKGWETYFKALSLYSVAASEKQPPGYRYACLRGAFHLMQKLIAEEANVSRVMSMAKVLEDLGKRVLAVEVLTHLAGFIETGEGNIGMNIDEPFLSPSDEFACMDSADRIAEWLYASILAQREKSRAFSSYYTGKESLEILDKIIDLGFPCDQMKRRRDLIRLRYKMD